jgi:hypothetical protein
MIKQWKRFKFQEVLRCRQESSVTLRTILFMVKTSVADLCKN